MPKFLFLLKKNGVGEGRKKNIRKLCARRILLEGVFSFSFWQCTKVLSRSRVGSLKSFRCRIFLFLCTSLFFGWEEKVREKMDDIMEEERGAGQG